MKQITVLLLRLEFYMHSKSSMASDRSPSTLRLTDVEEYNRNEYGWEATITRETAGFEVLLEPRPLKLSYAVVSLALQLPTEQNPEVE